jgi:hypothetical protein
MAAELGSMVVTQQIDALRVLGTDPVRRLVAPRLGAALVMIPVLTVIGDALGIFGAGLISIRLELRRCATGRAYVPSATTISSWAPGRGLRLSWPR